MNDTKILTFLKKNGEAGYTSKRIADTTKINIISTRRLLKKLKKNRKRKVNVTRLQMPVQRQLMFFYHIKEKQKIKKWVY